MSYVKYLFETFKSVTLCFKEGSGSVLMGALTISKQLTSRPRKSVTMGEEMTFEKCVIPLVHHLISEVEKINKAFLLQAEIRS